MHDGSFLDEEGVPRYGPSDVEHKQADPSQDSGGSSGPSGGDPVPPEAVVQPPGGQARRKGNRKGKAGAAS